MWGWQGGTEKLSVTVLGDCCWRLASQRQGWSASRDDVNLSDELDFQVSDAHPHFPVDVWILRADEGGGPSHSGC